jgi:hypothetical protein
MDATTARAGGPVLMLWANMAKLANMAKFAALPAKVAAPFR